MPQAAVETRVMDLLVAALQGIGTPPSNWRTTPAPQVVEGIPGDALPDGAPVLLYVDHAGTGPTYPEGDTSGHWHRVTLTVYCIARTVRDVLALKADVLQATFGLEQATANAFGTMLAPGAFAWRNDMTRAGLVIGQQDLFVDVYLTHSAP